MIQLRVRTEYSFREAFGRMADVANRLQELGTTHAAITDSGCWGHVAFAKTLKTVGVVPIFGVEILVVDDPLARTRQGGPKMAFLAKSAAGLTELYRLVTNANGEGYYYQPRLGYGALAELSDELYCLTGIGPQVAKLPRRPNVVLEFQPSAPGWNRQVRQLMAEGWPAVVCSDNLYVTPDDHAVYEMHLEQQARRRTTPQHLMSLAECKLTIPEAPPEAYALTEQIALSCQVQLPSAQMVRYRNPVPLLEQCRRGAARLGIDLTNPVYDQRLARELAMIAEKQFEDYFYVIADMVTTAKQSMLVGPARGSAAGSLVCYLLGITDVDPIVHDLMFERFIDVTRADLPDIDIDFPDRKRQQVLDHLVTLYGSDRVGRLGTINRYKAKSAIAAVAKTLRIPEWELKDLKGAILERSGGDARAQFCVQDAFETLDVGKAAVQKYPGLRIAGKLEGHARHSGMHAAGICITEEPMVQYAAIDRSGAMQLDKYDAESLNLLKIDALGLRTLSVIEECLVSIGKDHQWLRTYPLDDVAAFGVFNAERYAGIFQFEGYALQSLTRQMKVREFNDIVAITALARPGPLHCGAATDFINRRTGKEPVEPLHRLAEPLTKDSFGIVIYQEQVMAIGRVIGQLSWEDVSQLRKAMSKSLGEEFFNRYWVKFEAGAAAQGIDRGEARRIWEKICTFGSWAFNKSHAVSYGLLSYWCAVLKAHWPLEFAAACLRNPHSDEQSVKMLRELVEEGMEFTAVDPERSVLDWTVADGRLVGGLTAIKGVGKVRAQQLMTRRAAGKLTPGDQALLQHPVTPYDDLFEGRRRFAALLRHPDREHQFPGMAKTVRIRPREDGSPMPITPVRQIQENGEYVLIAKVMEKNLRDLNEYGNVVKRGGKLVSTYNLFLNLMLEDDTGTIIATVRPRAYPVWGKPLVEAAKVGDWFCWRGVIQNNWRKLYISSWVKIGDSAASDRAAITKARRAIADDIKVRQREAAKAIKQRRQS